MLGMTNVELNGALEPGFEEVLTPDAIEFVAELEKRFGSGRRDLLQTRNERRERLRSVGTLNFLDVRPARFTRATGT